MNIPRSSLVGAAGPAAARCPMCRSGGACMWAVGGGRRPMVPAPAACVLIPAAGARRMAPVVLPRFIRSPFPFCLFQWAGWVRTPQPHALSLTLTSRRPSPTPHRKKTRAAPARSGLVVRCSPDKKKDRVRVEIFFRLRERDGLVLPGTAALAVLYAFSMPAASHRVSVAARPSRRVASRPVPPASLL